MDSMAAEPIPIAVKAVTDTAKDPKGPEGENSTAVVVAVAAPLQPHEAQPTPQPEDPKTTQPTEKGKVDEIENAIAKGKCYNTTQEFHEACAAYAKAKGFQVRLFRKENDRVTIACSRSGRPRPSKGVRRRETIRCDCTWRCTARVQRVTVDPDKKEKDVWCVSSVNPLHKPPCEPSPEQLSILAKEREHLNPTVFATLKKILKGLENRSWKPKKVRQALNQHFPNIDLSHSQMAYAISKASIEIQEEKESRQVLATDGQALVADNPQQIPEAVPSKEDLPDAVVNPLTRCSACRSDQHRLPGCPGLKEMGTALSPKEWKVVKPVLLRNHRLETVTEWDPKRVDPGSKQLLSIKQHRFLHITKLGSPDETTTVDRPALFFVQPLSRSLNRLLSTPHWATEEEVENWIHRTTGRKILLKLPSS